MRRLTTKLLATILIALAPLSAWAGFTTLSYNGSVGNYWSLPILADDFPLGTPVSVTLTYNNSFVGLPATQFYLGMAPSMSGSLTLGSNHYALTGMSLTYFSYGPTAADPSPLFGFHVTGTGPSTDDGEVFSGMDLFFNSSWPGIPDLIGFGNTNWMVADNGYLILSGQTTYLYSVPAPGTLALTFLGILLLLLSRRSAMMTSLGRLPGRMNHS